MNPTYSVHGSDAFNAGLHETLLRLATDTEQFLGDNLVALILGGGYGRGEGAIIYAEDREMPYNDLDLFIVVVNKGAVAMDRLNAVGAPYAEEMSIHVDFSRPLTVQDVSQWPNWLMWYDLLNGHVVLTGPQDILSRHAPAALKEPLDPVEGAKLLINRGAGLLWALRVVRNVEPMPDEDFVLRNYYKCALALGDALLISHGRYATPYSGRYDRFEKLEHDAPDVAAFDLGLLYRDALRFKFRPNRDAFEAVDEQGLYTLAGKWGAVFLYVEAKRTGMDWASLDDYVAWNGIREREQNAPSRFVRNIIRNLQLGHLALRYPREALYRQLPVLLGLTDAKAQNWVAETEDFLRVWDRFN